MSGSFDEYDLLRRLASFGLGDAGLEVPNGDDAAVAAWNAGDRLVVALDTVVDGVHASGAFAVEELARKVVRANVSDLAAMGAEPRLFLLGLGLPRGGAEVADRVMEIVAAECRAFGMALAGGDTVVGPGPLTLSGTVIGAARGPVFRRSGAAPGDLLCATGAFGGSILGRHAAFTPRLEESRELARLGPPTAATDVSDGLARDTDNLARASGVGAVLESAAIPIHADARHHAARSGRDPLDHALHDGEDFELLFTWPAANRESLENGWKAPAPVRVLGRMIEEPGLFLEHAGRRERLDAGGYRHRS
ncbi:MAG: thiamine-phosphate kinase [Planctomycetota bacterium]